MGKTLILTAVSLATMAVAVMSIGASFLTAAPQERPVDAGAAGDYPADGESLLVAEPVRYLPGRVPNNHNEYVGKAEPRRWVDFAFAKPRRVLNVRVIYGIDGEVRTLTLPVPLRY